MNVPTYMIGILQVRAYRMLQSYVQAVLDNFDLNSTQWSILGLVSETTEGIRVMDVAERLGVEAPLVTMLSRPLIERDILKKVQPAADNRARLLVITPLGEQLVRDVEKILFDRLQILIRGVSEQEMDTYKKVLESIVSNGSAAQPISSDDIVRITKGGG